MVGLFSSPAGLINTGLSKHTYHLVLSLEFMDRTALKLIIVGDGRAGKTTLIMRFAQNMFWEDFIPTVYEGHVAAITVDDQHVELALWDTAGQEEYDRLRPLSYPNTHVVLVAFPIDNPDSLDNVLEQVSNFSRPCLKPSFANLNAWPGLQWIHEVRHFLPTVPIILVGCKKELRDDQRTMSYLESQCLHPVSFDEGMAVALKIGANRYFECSAKLGEGVDDIFTTAAGLALNFEREQGEWSKRRLKEKICVVL
ncbi:P-loop containing nucleoside triphosphate hydrolase protein [Flagelloscypha sp. PMI_526]|nr:P-loop containing nucleoside triphosphate hydrolase protein [Flagelloscypha sp. PMI_526]